MTLGEKLRAARLEAGLSQRQLCGDLITRNMLSKIENGTANPSMATLAALAARLEKPVSCFLEERPKGNSVVMATARACYDRQAYQAALEALEQYRGPDEDFEREWALLSALTLLSLAEQALAEGRPGLAREYLARAEPLVGGGYCRQMLECRRLLLLGRLGEPVGQKLPCLDEILLLQAKEALAENAPERARSLLAAARTRDPEWQLLQGRCALAARQWQEAAQALTLAEELYPGEAAPMLEQAYLQMGDYRRAYDYACKQKAK